MIDKAFAVAVKDIKEVFSSFSIYGPMIGMPLLFAVALPFLTVYVTIHAAPVLASELTKAHVTLPGAGNVTELLFMEFFAVNILGPIFLTMPILTAAVIAADSLAGEKERKTSEALLSMPITSSELLLGKILASFIPTILLTLLVFLVYGVSTNFFAYQAFQTYILPTPAWLMMIATIPFLALAPIALIVFVSGHVKGIKEAQQISTLLVLPVLIMPFISELGAIDLSVQFFTYMIIFLIAVDSIIMYISIRTFRKESML